MNKPAAKERIAGSAALQQGQQHCSRISSTAAGSAALQQGQQSQQSVWRTGHQLPDGLNVGLPHIGSDPGGRGVVKHDANHAHWAGARQACNRVACGSGLQERAEGSSRWQRERQWQIQQSEGGASLAAAVPASAAAFAAGLYTIARWMAAAAPPRKQPTHQVGCRQGLQVHLPEPFGVQIGRQAASAQLFLQLLRCRHAFCDGACKEGDCVYRLRQVLSADAHRHDDRACTGRGAGREQGGGVDEW